MLDWLTERSKDYVILDEWKRRRPSVDNISNLPKISQAMHIALTIWTPGNERWRLIGLPTPAWVTSLHLFH